MISIDTLNTMIAVVVVILVLSLIVQTLQGLIKKLFKLKSQQIESSLIDLFENALNASESDIPKRYESLLARFRIMRWLYAKVMRREHPSVQLDPRVQALYQEVTKKFKQVGRVAVTGKPDYESIARNDLLKVMDRLPIKTLFPEFATKIQTACDQIRSLEADLKKIQDEGLAVHLSETSAIKFSAMREAVAPLLNDTGSLLAGGAVNPESIAADIFNLREIKFTDILKILNDVQASAEQDLNAARQGGDQIKIDGLGALVEALKRVNDALIKFRVEVASAITPLRDKLLKVRTEVSTWYDTVMQSFEERYSRSMKTYAVILSFLVVVFFNANFFNIYSSIAGNAMLQAQLAELGQTINSQAANQGNQPATQPNQAQADQSFAQLKEQMDQYANLGFKPLTLQQASVWWHAWTLSTYQLKQDGRVLLGWLVMTLLLSIGAPFWQDTLESLFGVKNLIRKKGDIRKVEEQSGEGMTKS